MKKQILLAGLAVAAMLSPALAFAQSTDAQSQVQSLLSQIQSLEQQLKSLVASTSPGAVINAFMNASSTFGFLNGSSTIPLPWAIASSTPGMPAMLCIPLDRNLGIGSQGSDVAQLQNMLAQYPQVGFTASSTGYFGALTARAMAKFQTIFGIASSTNGSVGPLTRDFFGKECGNQQNGGGSNSQGGQGSGGQMGGMNIGGQGLMMRIVSGEVSANSGSTITITDTASSQPVVVDISASTTVMISASTSTPPTAGAVSDISVGENASAQGTQNSDGSINALRIQAGVIQFVSPAHPMRPMQGEQASSTRPGSAIPFFNPFMPGGGQGNGQQ